LTDPGRRALAAGKPSRIERIALRVIVASLALLSIGWLADRLT
jgi:hypothetical protein